MQERQTIPGEPKAPDNTRRAKSARQYPESQTFIKEPFYDIFFFDVIFQSYFKLISDNFLFIMEFVGFVHKVKKHIYPSVNFE